MKLKSELIRNLLLLLVGVIGIVVGYSILKPEEKLPIFSPADLNPELVDVEQRGITRKHRIADFSLTNQLGNEVTAANFEGKIYVADFFFTTCPTICPKMTKQMQRAAEEFANDTEIMFLSHSVTPQIDSVPILANYAERYQVNPEQWLLVTGDKKHIYELARKSYFAVTTKGDGGEDDFIHTENFVLVDKDKRIRGYYDGTSPEDVNRMIDEIRILKEEYAQ